MEKKLQAELSERETNIIAALKVSGALDWVYSKMETPEDKALVDQQINELAAKMQPAVDLIYNNIKIPGIAEKFYEQLLPQINNMKEEQKKEDKE